jgi:RNA polymerase sigma-54 factor
MANMLARPESLQEYLEHQLAWFGLDDTIRRMAERIIFSLDSNGYLKSPLEELLPPIPAESNGDAARFRAEYLATAEQALSVVQRLDPPGVGARSLKECLLLQLVPGMPDYDELRTLIADHLEDLENNRLPQISKKTGYSIEKIQEVWQELRKLKPKPGADFSETTVPSVTPDVFVERNEQGQYEVRLEDTQLPSLYISPYYRNLLKDEKTNAETREYIKRKVNSAQWLIESIEQRRSTLTRVSQAIVDHQTKFLDDGPDHIEPLKMQQIADKVGVHVTTVSRAVDDKWIQTPRGIFPLKRFFVGGTTSADGEEVAWDRVRIKLQEIIDNEDKTAPLSDDAVVEELAKAGITVARRTVTKYRKAMNIPSSRGRRDWSKGEK